MDCFKHDGVDNQLQVQRMVESYHAFEEAYRGLSEPIRTWFDRSFLFEGMWLAAPIAHIGTSIDCLAELLGVED